MNTIFTIVMSILGIVVWVVLMGLLFAIPTMLLWDYLMPALFGFKEITLLQAWALNVLCGLLFKTSASSSKS